MKKASRPHEEAMVGLLREDDTCSDVCLGSLEAGLL